MTWQAHHDRSAELAGQAEIALHRGDPSAAMALYREAGVAEAEALKEIDPSDSFLVGITAVSVAALHFKGGEEQAAEKIVHLYLAKDDLIESSRQRLEELLEQIHAKKQWRDARLTWAATLRFALRGGEIIHGAGPADIVNRTSEAARALVTRSIEHALRVPYRSSGAPSPTTIGSFRPWIVQAPAGSFQFDIAIQPSVQGELIPVYDVSPEAVVQSSAEILAAASQSPDARLPEIVPGADYRRSFLKITKDLIPDGQGFRRLEVRTPSEETPIVLRSASREIVAEAIKRLSADADQDGTSHEDVEISGILRNVHLDSEWIEVRVDATKHRIADFNEELAAQAGKFLNRKITLSVQRDQADKLYFRDINEAD